MYDLPAKHLISHQQISVHCLTEHLNLKLILNVTLTTIIYSSLALFYMSVKHII